MYREIELKSTQQSTDFVDYTKSNTVGLTAQRFLEDFCHLSFSLKPKKESSKFYYTDSKKLKELLQMNYGTFEHDFDKVIHDSIYNLLVYGKVYIETVLYFDKNENLCQLKLIPIRYKKMIRIFNRLYYTVKKYDGSRQYGYIDCKNLIKLTLKDVGYRKRTFSSLFRKMDRNETKYNKLMYDKELSGDFDYVRRRKDYKTLKVNKKTFWTENTGNEYISEPYLVYRSMQFDLLQNKLLDYVLNNINISLETIGKLYGFVGKIEYRAKTEKYNEYFEKFYCGKMNCNELADLIF